MLPLFVHVRFLVNLTLPILRSAHKNDILLLVARTITHRAVQNKLPFNTPPCLKT